LFNAFKITKDSFPCPYPLVAPDNQDHTQTNVANGVCGQRCPSISMPDTFKYIHNIIVLVGSTLSFILGLFTFSTYVVFEQKREHLLNVNYAFTFLVWTIFNGIAWAYRYDDYIASVGCIDNTTLDAPSTVTFCRVWLPLIVMCGNSMLYSWFFIIIDLSLKIIFEYRISKQESRYLQLKMVIFSWILSAVQSSVIGALRGASGSLYGSIPCATNSLLAEYIAIDFTILLCGCIGLVLTGYMLHLFRISHAATQSENHTNPAANVLLMASFRLLVISFLMGLYFLLIPLNNFIAPIGSDDERQQLFQIREYANCIADTYGDLSICGPYPKLDPVGVVWFALQFLYASPGLIAFLILGCQQSNFTLWSQLLGCTSDPPLQDNQTNASNKEVEAAVTAAQSNKKSVKKNSILFSKSHGRRSQISSNSAKSSSTEDATRTPSDVGSHESALITVNDSEEEDLTPAPDPPSFLNNDAFTPSVDNEHIQLTPVQVGASTPTSSMESKSHEVYSNIDKMSRKI
jgi:hypothetical protein